MANKAIRASVLHHVELDCRKRINSSEVVLFVQCFPQVSRSKMFRNIFSTIRKHWIEDHIAIRNSYLTTFNKEKATRIKFKSVMEASRMSDWDFIYQPKITLVVWSRKAPPVGTTSNFQKKTLANSKVRYYKIHDGPHSPLHVSVDTTPTFTQHYFIHCAS